MIYPPPLQEIVDLFASLPEDERRENLILFADQAALYEPRPGEMFTVEDERKDEECTDKVGVYLRVEAGRRAHFRVRLGGWRVCGRVSPGSIPFPNEFYEGKHCIFPRRFA